MTSERYGFGEFVLDAMTMELRRSGQLVKLELKPREVLIELVRGRGELVSKKELFDRVWVGRVVGESVLSRCISKLREALGDFGDTTPIQTVHSFGFKFTADVVDLASSPDAAMQPLLPALTAESLVPLRPNWRLKRQLDLNGDCWLAEHVKLGTLRVFKFANTAERIAAMKRELLDLRLLRAALHERKDFLTVVDYNITDLPYFLELPYLPLGSLDQWLAPGAPGANSDLQTRIDLLIQAAESMADAHDIAVLHRDIKPSNLLIREDGQGGIGVCWADFGTAGIDQEVAQKYQLTVTGWADGMAENLGGTPMYMAPRRFEGAPATIQSDVYSLGVMLFQACVSNLKRPLTVGWESDVADELLREDIRFCCDYDLAVRFPNARILAQRLRDLEPRRQALSNERAERERVAKLELNLARFKQNRIWVAVVAIVLVGGLGGESLAIAACGFG